MAEAGGGWMSDYDTIPLVISPGSMPEKFTSYQRHVPSLMAGTAQEWADLVMHMADVAETTAAGGVNPDGRQSDMLELYEVHERDKAQGKSHYASKYEVADFAQAFMAASMTDEEAARFCNKYKNKRALHVSHHSVFTEHLDSQKRDVYMRQARKTFHSACLADRSQVEANALAAHAAPAAPAVSTTSRFLQDFVDAKGIWPKVEERGLPSFFFDQQRAASGDILRKLLNSAVRGRAELSVYKACKSRSKGGGRFLQGRICVLTSIRHSVQPIRRPPRMGGDPIPRTPEQQQCSACCNCQGRQIFVHDKFPETARAR